MGKIIWIASYPKSGNTWLRIFLFNLFADSPEPMTLSEVSHMSTSDTVLRWYREVDERDPASWTMHDVADLRLVMQRHMTTQSLDAVFMKTHAALVPMAGRQPFDMEASAGAVYIVRNPLDVAVSYMRHAGVPADQIVDIMSTPNHMLPRTDDLAEFVQGGWSQNVMSWTREPNPAIHVVRYEDLAAKGMETFGAICSFLKLEMDEERVARALDHASITTLRRLEDEQGFNERSVHQERFFGEGGVDAWKRDLPEENARQLVQRHRAQMERFGYVPPGW
ncbi:MAG: sulfotransferase domain-containing protein [Alphaproteobacteria bacterium]|jgi:hypothetical protein|nr:hypothetical protein [Rhodospirillaceae bacterium]MDG2479958.1 sulfotransferase domain-containing protein [Alphaproteobacteria bacterium]MBT6203301.1 hypothetical protein [Rhodospirillaceae bacterium]MBT6510145.1 hypothetical protein [Rhodospirillaceae bacterium]MBT7614427.1 hypothetical protein [Rhodospirillaceae bacterium]